MRKDLIAIDPGKNSAYCMFKNKKIVGTGLIKISGKTNEEIVNNTFCNMSVLFDLHKPKYVIIEGVRMWDASPVSVIATKKGDLFSLAYIVGVIASCATAINADIKIVNAQNWKGNMSKEVTKKRVQKFLGDESLNNEHVIDAIGIGLSEYNLL